MHNARKILKDEGCILEGDFFFALKKRGLVSKQHINLDPIFTKQPVLYNLVGALIKPFTGMFDCIVGPAIGGIPLVYTASQIMISDYSKYDISTAFAEKNGDTFKFVRMGFAEAVRDKDVLILEDISSTGETTRGVSTIIREVGGHPTFASLLWNRGDVTSNMIGVEEMHSLIEERVETFLVAESPPGWGELPLVNDIGHPEYYPNYPGPKINLIT